MNSEKNRGIIWKISCLKMYLRRIEGKKKMKQLKQYYYQIMNIIAVMVTVIFDVCTYSRLPQKIATQISFHGDRVNTMPKLVYMLTTVGIMVLLFAFGYSRDKAVRIKYTVVNIVLLIANIIMISMQL